MMLWSKGLRDRIGSCRASAGRGAGAAGQRDRVAGRAPPRGVPGFVHRRPVLLADRRPSLPADLIGSVLVLKVKERFDLSDPQTADAVRHPLEGGVQAVADAGVVRPVHLGVLAKRIAASDRPNRVFDVVARVIAETGILRGRRKRSVDSTVFDDAVATQDTVTRLVAAMRKVARLVPGARPVIERVAKLDYSKPGKPDIDWDDPQATQNLVSDLVTDALAVLGELTGEDAPHREGPAADALGLLALVAANQQARAPARQGTPGR
jgi:hypothetical protein